MKACELCGNPARMYCESDQASLCWDCDDKVHAANFLVAKHCRTLLCRTCQSLTPWKASGSNLAPTVSVCDSCFSSHSSKIEQDRPSSEKSLGRNGEDEEECEDYEEDEVEEEEEEEGEYSEEEAEAEEEEEEEDGENQVVPWSDMGSSAPPVASSSSSDEEISSGFPAVDGLLKRMRDNNADLDSDDDIGCSSSQQGYGRYISNEEGTSYSSFSNNKPLKRARTSEDHEEDNHGEEGSAVIIDSIKKLQRDMVCGEQSASATILGICKLSRDQRV